MDPAVAGLVPLLGVLGGNWIFPRLPRVGGYPLGLCFLALRSLGFAAALAACLARSTLMSMLFPVAECLLPLSPGLELRGVSPMLELLVLVQLDPLGSKFLHLRAAPVL